MIREDVSCLRLSKEAHIAAQDKARFKEWQEGKLSTKRLLEHFKQNNGLELINIEEQAFVSWLAWIGWFK